MVMLFHLGLYLMHILKFWIYMTLEPQDRIKFQVENKGVSFSSL